MRTRRSALACAAAACLLAPAAPALAHDEPPGQASPGYTEVVSGFLAPLHLDVDRRGRLYVADAFAGAVVRVDPRTGARSTLVADPDYFVPGVGVRDGKVYAVGSENAAEGEQGGTALARIRGNGSVRVVADLLAHELEENPDGQPQTGYPEPDAVSNPYAVLPLKRSVLVADAAGNDILQVWPNGDVRTLAVLPVSRTGECATATNNGVPDGGCDPTPTDLKLGRDGYLYVSGLGGEIEGHVWKVDPRTGEVVHQWDGFPPLTGLALDRRGNIYVSSLFADQVFRITRSGERLVASVPGPTGLAWHDGHLYAGSVTLGPVPSGSVLVVSRGAFAPPA